MPKGDILTPKQELFVSEILKGKNYTEAYNVAYTPKKQKPETINRNAYSVFYNTKIQTRIKQLRAKIEQKLIYTATQSFNKLNEMQEKALELKRKIYIKDVSIPFEEETPDLKSAIKAEELKGKLAQLYTDKSEVNHSGIIVLNFDSEDKKA